MDINHRQRLAWQVARRQRLAAAGVGAFWCAAGLTVVGILWLAGARLLALWPERPASPSILLGIAGALTVGAALWAWTRLPAALTSARLIDRSTDGKDLFLTAAVIDHSPGEYQAIVLGQADERAMTVRAADVVPFRWQTRTWRLAALVAVFAVAAVALPKLDPLGFYQQRQQIARQHQRIEESRRATQERAKTLQQRPPDEPKIAAAVAKLEEAFRKAEPTLQKENQEKLAESQKELGALWKQVNDNQLKSALQSSKVEQAFGTASPQESERWKEALRNGDVSALQKELQDLEKQLNDLAAKPDSAEKRAEQAQLQQKVAAMANSAAKALQSPGLNSALSRAMDQLAQGRQGSLSSEAMKAAGESLKLSQQELDALAKNLQNAKSLDEALKSAQLAKQCNAQGKLDGQGTGQCKSMGDYAALYAAKLAQAGDPKGIGHGMGQKGVPSAGGKARENGGAKTAYQSEKSPTNLTGGQLEAQWQTSEVSEPGEVRRDDPGALAQNAQRVSEAITAEQVPPGYHAAIQKYFDTVPAAATAPSALVEAGKGQ